MKITLPGETPSLKNSKEIVFAGRKPKLIPSAHYRQWHAVVKSELINADIEPVDYYPVKVDFLFYRSSKRIFDFINAAQGPLDLLVELGILAADDMNHVIPGAFSWQVDKNNPRVELVITEL